ncbi:DNA repair protein RecO [Salimicrobium halophilum]|uniref:DNA repair protein RecO n=1 Tax=Salimicrobium halophilum TaxID=86666 RepID=A0A1G8PQI6_9BACI|nr:DNA repair protein RecO [Salimicrobium halophilum]SDI94727.1 DNA replication and repair protein RecO [Salimicrobium halophilum]
MLEKVEGVVIRTSDYGETHKIITLWTREKGKISVIARGAKKPKSRMSSVTQPFIYGNYLIYIGKGMGSMSQGEVIDSFRSVREDIVKAGYSSFACELADKLLEEREPDPFLFEQLLTTITYIDEGRDPDIVTMIFELKIYRKAGFAPVLSRCINCGREEGPFAFSVREGGYLCGRCKYLDSSAYPLSERFGKLLPLLAEMDVKRLGNVSMKKENKEKLRQLLDQYYEQYGGYFLKSRKFLKQLDRFY